MAILLKKNNIDLMNEIILLVDLYYIENFKFYNKYQSLLAKYLDFLRKRVLKKEFVSQIDII